MAMIYKQHLQRLNLVLIKSLKEVLTKSHSKLWISRTFFRKANTTGCLLMDSKSVSIFTFCGGISDRG
jgi:hypothetical protein